VDVLLFVLTLLHVFALRISITPLFQISHFICCCYLAPPSPPPTHTRTSFVHLLRCFFNLKLFVSASVFCVCTNQKTNQFLSTFVCCLSDGLNGIPHQEKGKPKQRRDKPVPPQQAASRLQKQMSRSEAQQLVEDFVVRSQEGCEGREGVCVVGSKKALYPHPFLPGLQCCADTMG
jgi:hypothetical protein